MTLINSMLTDLEDRRAQIATEGAIALDDLSAARYLAPEKRFFGVWKRVPVLVALTLLIALILFGQLQYWQYMAGWSFAGMTLDRNNDTTVANGPTTILRQEAPHVAAAPAAPRAPAGKTADVVEGPSTTMSLMLATAMHLPGDRMLSVAESGFGDEQLLALDEVSMLKPDVETERGYWMNEPESLSPQQVSHGHRSVELPAVDVAGEAAGMRQQSNVVSVRSTEAVAQKQPLVESGFRKPTRSANNDRQVAQAEVQRRQNIARLLVERNAVEQALALLQSDQPLLADFPAYHAFIAALLQRTGQHAAAAERYRQVLAIRPEEASWWVGRAISLEALEHPADAIAAYNSALRTGNLNAALQRYSHSRIAGLNKQVTDGRQ